MTSQAAVTWSRAWPTSVATHPAEGTTARTRTHMMLPLLLPDRKKETLPPGWKVKEEITAPAVDPQKYLFKHMEGSRGGL